MTTAILDDARAGTATGTLHMIRADIDALQFRRWMGSRRIVDDDHAMHCLLRECFGDFYTQKNPQGIAPQPFRLIIPRDKRCGTLYGYSRADAEELRDAASMLACPLQAKVLPPSSIDSKLMPSEWHAGRRLGFEVRVRPIVRLQRELDRVPHGNLRLFRQVRRNGEIELKWRPGAECDAYQHEAIMYQKGEMKRSREEVYAEWLQARFENKGGAVLDMETVKMVSFRRTRAIRKLHRRYSEGTRRPNAG